MQLNVYLARDGYFRPRIDVLGAMQGKYATWVSWIYAFP